MSTNNFNPFESYNNKLSQILEEQVQIKNLLCEIVSNKPAKNESKFININELCEIHPKKPAKATVYSWLSIGVIPKDLIYKPQGSKVVLFEREKVLNWINLGCPTNAQSIAGNSIENVK